MPAPPYADVVGNIARVTMAALYPQGVRGQQVQETNIHYAITATGGGDTRAGLRAALDGFFVATVVPLMATTAQYWGSKVSMLNMIPPPTPKVSRNTAMGTGSGSQLPTQVRGLLSLTTNVAGRTGRGRMYVFTGDDTTFDASGNPSAGYVAMLGTLAGQLANPVVTGGTTWSPCIAHRHAGPPPFYTYDLVTGITRQDFYCTQRRSGESGRVNATPW